MVYLVPVDRRKQQEEFKRRTWRKRNEITVVNSCRTLAGNRLPVSQQEPEFNGLDLNPGAAIVRGGTGIDLSKVLGAKQNIGGGKGC